MKAAPRSATCLLLLPGFSPDNVPVIPLKQDLERAGFSVVAANFWGEKNVDDLSALTADFCTRGVTDTITRLTKQYRSVIGIGISLGGALLIEHAKKHNDLAGIISIGTPFCLKNKWFIKLALALFPITRFVVGIINRFLSRRLPPIESAKEIFGYLRRAFLHNLGNVTTPLLLIQSGNDGVTDSRCSKRYVHQFGSKEKDLKFIDGKNHVFEYDGGAFMHEVVAFCDTHGPGHN
jgi:esterase/lipase